MSRVHLQSRQNDKDPDVLLLVDKLLLLPRYPREMVNQKEGPNHLLSFVVVVGVCKQDLFEQWFLVHLLERRFNPSISLMSIQGLPNWPVVFIGRLFHKSPSALVRNLDFEICWTKRVSKVDLENLPDVTAVVSLGGGTVSGGIKLPVIEGDEIGVDGEEDKIA